MSKTLDMAHSLLDEIATKIYQWTSECSSVKKVAGLWWILLQPLQLIFHLSLLK